MKCKECGRDIEDVQSEPLNLSEVDIYSDSINRLNAAKALLEFDKIPFELMDETKTKYYLSVIVNEYANSFVAFKKVTRHLLSNKPKGTFIRADDKNSDILYFSIHKDDKNE
jgi:hypothetical protein